MLHMSIHPGMDTMRTGTKRGRGRAKGAPGRGDPRDELKKPRSFRLAAGKIARARRILGAPSDTETIEAALDAVVLREELISGTKAAFGIVVDPAAE
jgi:hypothetical protein